MGDMADLIPTIDSANVLRKGGRFLSICPANTAYGSYPILPPNKNVLKSP